MVLALWRTKQRGVRIQFLSRLGLRWYNTRAHYTAVCHKSSIAARLLSEWHLFSLPSEIQIFHLHPFQFQIVCLHFHLHQHLLRSAAPTSICMMMISNSSNETRRVYIPLSSPTSSVMYPWLPSPLPLAKSKSWEPSSIAKPLRLGSIGESLIDWLERMMMMMMMMMMMLIEGRINQHT